MSIPGGVTSSNGDLRYVGGGSIPTTGHVTQEADLSNDALYQIPEDKLRGPANPITLNAGVYVVTRSGQLMYYNMN